MENEELELNHGKCSTAKAMLAENTDLEVHNEFFVEVQFIRDL